MSSGPDHYRHYPPLARRGPEPTMSDAESDAAYREQAEALIADLRARVSHYEALVVAVREETLTKAALAVDGLFLRVAGFDGPWARGYVGGIKDSAYAVRELRATPPAKTGADQ